MICTSSGGSRSRCDAEQQGARLGGRGQQDRRDHAEGALGQDVPGAEQARLAEREAEHLDPLAGREERQQHREQHERHLDDHPPQRRRRPAPGPRSATAASSSA